MTAFVLSSNDKYLLGVLNSSLMNFFFLKISASVRGQTFRFKKQYMEQIPILSASDTQKKFIIDPVQDILADPDRSKVPLIEEEINRIVYELYNLTPKEIAIVEGKK